MKTKYFTYSSLIVYLFLLLMFPTPLQPAVCSNNPGKDGSGNIGGVVNTYYPATASVGAGAGAIPVGPINAWGSQTPISAGDLLLVIQMQDATIDYTDTDSYGDGTAGAPASGQTGVGNTGTFEYVLASGPVAGGVVPLSTPLQNAYHEAAATATLGQKTYQVVRVPQYANPSLTSNLTAAYWNGSSGGVLAFDVCGTMNLNNATVSVDGTGFRGGGGFLGTGGGDVAGYVTVVDPTGADTSAEKGEGIAGTPRLVANAYGGTIIDTGVEGYPGGSARRGAPANAGGGGNQWQSGGGGGSNAGAGGTGGDTISFIDDPYGGYGGAVFPSSSTSLIMGGGGGAGASNNGGNEVNFCSGGAGGGIVMIRTGSVAGTGTISANGTKGVDGGAWDENNAGNNNESASGGSGGGGSVLISSAGALGGLTCERQRRSWWGQSAPVQSS